MLTDLDFTLEKRSLSLSGHKTSVSMERLFWLTLEKMAHEQATSMQALIESVDRTRQTNLSSALRVTILSSLLDSNSHEQS